MRVAGWPVVLRHQSSFWPPQTHWPQPLRWRFGPQPPNANAGVIADDRAAERTTIPISLTERLFIITSASRAIEVNENIQQHNASWRHSPDAASGRLPHLLRRGFGG